MCSQRGFSQTAFSNNVDSHLPNERKKKGTLFAQCFQTPDLILPAPMAERREPLNIDSAPTVMVSGATSHPFFVMSCSFTNQILTLRVLPSFFQGRMSRVFVQKIVDAPCWRTGSRRKCPRSRAKIESCGGPCTCFRYFNASDFGGGNVRSSQHGLSGSFFFFFFAEWVL